MRAIGLPQNFPVRPFCVQLVLPQYTRRLCVVMCPTYTAIRVPICAYHSNPHSAPQIDGGQPLEALADVHDIEAFGAATGLAEDLLPGHDSVVVTNGPRPRPRIRVSRLVLQVDSLKG